MAKRKSRYAFAVFMFLFPFVLGDSAPVLPISNVGGNTAQAHVMEKMTLLQIPFIANGGQADEEVKFYAKTMGGTFFVTREGEMVYAFPVTDHGVASLRGRDLPVPQGATQAETTEAILHGIEDEEIATLSRPGGIARNDQKGILSQSLIGGAAPTPR